MKPMKIKPSVSVESFWSKLVGRIKDKVLEYKSKKKG